MYIEESFDTIFNMGYVGRTTPPSLPPMDYGSGKSPMDERIKINIIDILILCYNSGQ